MRKQTIPHRIRILTKCTFRVHNTFGKVFAISAKGDNFSDILFALLHDYRLLKSLLCKWRICLLIEQIPFRRGQNSLTWKWVMFSALQTKAYAVAKSVDPDETAHNEPSHQDLHCLPFCFVFWLTFKYVKMDMSKFIEEKVHFINSWWKELILRPIRQVRLAKTSLTYTS